jgi:hypothetical protein
MFRWLRAIFTRRQYRIAQPWETPAEVRKKLRCASAGIDPQTVQEPTDGRTDGAPDRPVLQTQPPSNR